MKGGYNFSFPTLLHFPGELLLNALISDQLESCQRLKLKAVKMEQELFDNDDKLTELEEAEVVYVLQTSCDGSVAKPRSMLNKAIFDPWQRSLFSR